MPSSRNGTLPDASASPAWRGRAREIALELARHSRPGTLSFDIQRVFAWLPPERPAGEALFRLVEAFARTPDRAGRLALVREYVRIVPARAAALALPFVALGAELVGRQFVFEEDIRQACARGIEELAKKATARFSFDMLG